MVVGTVELLGFLSATGVVLGFCCVKELLGGPIGFGFLNAMIAFV